MWINALVLACFLLVKVVYYGYYQSNNDDMKVIVATALAALILPFGVYGAQAVFTADNVTTAYHEQIKAIDAEIARLEGTKKPITASMSFEEKWAIIDGHNLEVDTQIRQLEEDKHVLDVAYNLVITSFR